MERNTYRIVRADGSEETVNARPQLDRIYRQIGCDCIDTVILTWDFEEIKP